MAAIGVTVSGDRWVAAVNWVSPSASHEVWGSIKEVIPFDEYGQQHDIGGD